MDRDGGKERWGWREKERGRWGEMEGERDGEGWGERRGQRAQLSYGGGGGQREVK
jgi:hypothetical protein